MGSVWRYLSPLLVMFAGAVVSQVPAGSAFADDLAYDIKVVVTYFRPNTTQPTSEQALAMATYRFDRYFPFSTNCKGQLKVDAVCNLNYLGHNNPVKVAAIGRTSYSFISLEGHTEGKDRKITFRFENTKDRLYLYVHAEGPGSWPAWATKYGMVAKDTWEEYGFRLMNGIAAGEYWIDGGVTEELPPVPPRPEAVDVARTFATAWARPKLPQQEWFDGLKPYATRRILDLLVNTDPTRVPADKITGDPVSTNRFASFEAAEFTIATNAGTLVLTLVVDNMEAYRVNAVDWIW